jgi:hypothetical protein
MVQPLLDVKSRKIGLGLRSAVETDGSPPAEGVDLSKKVS